MLKGILSLVQLALYAVIALGWVLNAVALFTHTAFEQTEYVLRIVGLFVPALGAGMGYGWVL